LRRMRAGRGRLLEAPLVVPGELERDLFALLVALLAVELEFDRLRTRPAAGGPPVQLTGQADRVEHLLRDLGRRLRAEDGDEAQDRAVRLGDFDAGEDVARLLVRAARLHALA